MARIASLRYSRDGQIREVALVTAAKRRIKRPTMEKIQKTIKYYQNHQQKRLRKEESKHPYNLRPLKLVNYAEPITTNLIVGRTTPRQWFLFHIMMFSLIATVLLTGVRGEEITLSEKGTIYNAAANTTFKSTKSQWERNRQNSDRVYADPHRVEDFVKRTPSADSHVSDFKEQLERNDVTTAVR
ncbi:hypothetical protein COOONC_00699 [Cooperia oncophora]